MIIQFLHRLTLALSINGLCDSRKLQYQANCLAVLQLSQHVLLAYILKIGVHGCKAVIIFGTSDEGFVEFRTLYTHICKLYIYICV